MFRFKKLDGKGIALSRSSVSKIEQVEVAATINGKDVNILQVVVTLNDGTSFPVVGEFEHIAASMGF